MGIGECDQNNLTGALLVHKSRLGLIILSIITKNRENRPNHPKKWSQVTPRCLLNQSKTIQMVFRSLNIMFEVHY